MPRAFGGTRPQNAPDMWRTTPEYPGGILWCTTPEYPGHYVVHDLRIPGAFGSVRPPNAPGIWSALCRAWCLARHHLCIVVARARLDAHL